MLQDLDSLTARIEQMVNHTRRLQSERASLLARVKSLEEERDRLTAQVQSREADFSSVAGELAQHEAKLQSMQNASAYEQNQLRLQLEEYRTKCAQTEQLLQASRQNENRLKVVSDAARRQIDNILVRLPGA